MSSLIDRLENAREGSREMDAEIYRMVPPRRSSDPDDEPRHAFVPHYTTSIDAALTALPEGWLGETTFGGYHFHLAWVQNGNDRSTKSAARGHTPALALITAILKALTTEKEG